MPTLRLRPHHLLCMLTFAGAGYTPEFVENLGRIVERIGAGEPIALADGPDDICAPLVGDTNRHCDGASVARRDRAALLALTDAGFDVGARPLIVTPADVGRLRAAFRDGVIRAACRGCEWDADCTRIAADGYIAARLTTEGTLDGRCTGPG